MVGKRRFKITKGLLLFIPVILLLQSCSDQDRNSTIQEQKLLSDDELKLIQLNKEPVEELVFGFDLRSSPSEDAKQYLPFLKYLEKTTGYKFKLRFTPEDGQIIDDLGKGVIQLAAIGATSYIKAANKYGVRPLARGINLQGKAEYRSFLVVHPESNITELADLKNKRMAFGSKNSTQGYLIPRVILKKNNILLDDLDDYFFTGSHQNCAEAVISQKADACGMQDTMASNLAAQGKLRVIHRSDYFPSSGIVINNNVPVDVAEKIKKALLDFDPVGRNKNGLYHWERTEMPRGFTDTNDQDYQALRLWMQNLGVSKYMNYDGAIDTRS